MRCARYLRALRQFASWTAATRLYSGDSQCSPSTLSPEVAERWGGDRDGERTIEPRASSARSNK